ncbi:MAG: AAA family ATPase [Dysgonomonas sp.]|nr:AAA family ATPase [Dysgonomonas sp.]
MMMQKDNFFILTGGPGSGKTSVLYELRNQGYKCVEELGRKIIKQQLAIGGDAIPWKDAQAYAELMLEYSINDYVSLERSEEIYFFDRGIPDTYGYAKLVGLDVTLSLLCALRDYQYNSKVFIFPPWKDVYENDNERKQDFEEAVDTYDMMMSVYGELGYELIIVPVGTIQERVNFLLSNVHLVV